MDVAIVAAADEGAAVVSVVDAGACVVDAQAAANSDSAVADTTMADEVPIARPIIVLPYTPAPLTRSIYP